MSKLILSATLLILVFTQQSFCAQFNFISLATWLQENQNIQYQKCFDQYIFNFKPFPISIDRTQQPSTGIFQETFILKIPNGRIISDIGCVITDNNDIIIDFIWKKRLHNLNNIVLENLNPVRIPGAVAIITQSAHTNYWHWISEVLCRLALLDLYNIQYDYICIPQTTAFMKDSLMLWGIDPSKIITLSSNHLVCIQADELIVPSLVSNIDSECPLLSCYAQQHLLTHVRNKLLAAAQKQHYKPFAKNIFISRKDTPLRNILNEDEIFALLQPYGFERYELTPLSVTEQILLFHDANVIIAPQGTCLANTIFCDSKTTIIELFQGLCDSTFWYTSQMFQQNYTPLPTIPFITDYFTAWQTHTTVPPQIIEQLIKDLVSTNKISLE